MLTASAEHDPVRASMARLPKAAQPLLTWLTGCPLPMQQPLLRLSPLASLAITTGCLLLYVGLSIWICVQIVHGGSWLLLAGLALTILMTVSAIRNIHMNGLHHLAHGSVFARTSSWNRHVYDILAGLTLYTPWDAYRKLHVASHHVKLGTQDDMQRRIIESYRLQTSGRPDEMWRRLARLVLSVGFHAKLLNLKVVPYLRRGARLYRITYALLIMGCVVCAIWLGSVWPVLVAYVIPVTLLSQSAFIFSQWLEHPWGRDRPAGADFMDFNREFSYARFCGEAAPAATDSGLKWARWGLRMLFVHLPVRLLVVPGDIIVHDYHHVFSSSRKWPTAIYERQAHVRQGGWQHSWGIADWASVVLGSYLATRDRC